MNRNQSFLFVFFALAATAIMRVIPHPFNFTPVAAMALFGAAYGRNIWYSFLLPLGVMLVSDILVMNTVQTVPEGPWMYLVSPTAISVYFAFLLTVCIGLILKRNINTLNIIGASILSSLLFYFTTNFGSWKIDMMNMYPDGIEGLWMALAAGIPFYNNSITGSFFLNGIVGDLFFSTVLFGAYALVNKSFFHKKAIA